MQAVRPKRQTHPPCYLDDCEVDTVSYKRHHSPEAAVMYEEEREWRSDVEGEVGMTPTTYSRSPYPQRQVQGPSPQEDEYFLRRNAGYDRRREATSEIFPPSPDPWAATCTAELQIRMEHMKLRQTYEYMLDNIAQIRDIHKDMKSLTDTVKALGNPQAEHQHSDLRLPPPPPPPSLSVTDRDTCDSDWPPPPPWPSAGEGAEPSHCHEREMVSALDRMMRELQLLK